MSAGLDLDANHIDIGCLGLCHRRIHICDKYDFARETLLCLIVAFRAGKLPRIGRGRCASLRHSEGLAEDFFQLACRQQGTSVRGRFLCSEGSRVEKWGDD